MNPSPDTPAFETLSGRIDRITYLNEENGYTVAQVIVPGRDDPVTVVGNLINPIPGEFVKMKGTWGVHATFGKQFRVDSYTVSVPTTIDGIRKYLGSGLIKGIGPKMADRIIRRFGQETLDIIGENPQRLMEVEGIGAKRVDMVKATWQNQKEIRDVMIFLQSYGIGAAYAARIYKQYDRDTILVVRDNPYQLAEDISGIGFTTADRVAAKLGFDRQSEFRVRAGVIYLLHRLAEEGHVYYPFRLLISKARELLDVEPMLIEKALNHIQEENKVVIERPAGVTDGGAMEDASVYLSHFHFCETQIAAKLVSLGRIPSDLPTTEVDRALTEVQRRLSIALASEQIHAVKKAFTQKVLIVTGGPGTGKTTIIDVIVRVCHRLGQKTLLAAPTGRAAKRMSEATGHSARTIHRLLEFSFQKGGFQRNEDRPLNCRYLVIDEVSMIDTVLMHQLLKAVALDTSLILVGDVHQLPSVGAGMVLGDIIASGCFGVVGLTEIFRQAQSSRIIVNAHRINEGEMPDLSPMNHKTDFYFRKRDDPQEALGFIINLVTDHIPRVFGFDPMEDIQVLSPMHKGAVGAVNLNRELQETLNPHGDAVRRGDFRLRVGDKVMQVKNNYDREVFNGDMGRIHRIDPDAREVIVNFDGRPVNYPFAEIGELSLAYAISVHKSQGSEYPAVVIPLLTQHYVLLQRNLLYTAVTRGKKLVVVVGSKKALAMAVKNAKTQMRYTKLDKRLQGYR